MRYALVLVLAAGLVVLTACGGDAEPDNRPGAEGAFGEADDCAELADQAIEARQRVLTNLGDASRAATERIDEALASFGGDGPDLAVRFEGLGCDRSFGEAVCGVLGDLQAGGLAGEDLLDSWESACN